MKRKTNTAILLAVPAAKNDTWNLGKLPGYPLTDQSAFGPFKH